MIDVFFDGSCPLCTKEIAHYQKIASANDFNWVDISQPNALAPYPFSFEETMRYLHCIDDDRKTQIGVKAFIVIWRKLPGWRWLAPIAQFPLVYYPLSVCYKIFADQRIKRRKKCNDKTCH